MEKKFQDELYIEFRNELEQREEDLKSLEETEENNIVNGYIILESEKRMIEEKFVRERFYLLAPEEFTELPRELWKIKYPAFRSENAIIYTNEDASINLLFDFKETELEPEDVETARNQARDVLQKLRPDLELREEGMLDSYLSPVGYFSFISPSLDALIYNLNFLFALEGELVVGTFNCLETEHVDWEEIARQMLGTLNSGEWEEE